MKRWSSEHLALASVCVQVREALRALALRLGPAERVEVGRLCTALTRGLKARGVRAVTRRRAA